MLPAIRGPVVTVNLLDFFDGFAGEHSYSGLAAIVGASLLEEGKYHNVSLEGAVKVHEHYFDCKRLAQGKWCGTIALVTLPLEIP